jgi:hypothetical protein
MLNQVCNEVWFQFREAEASNQIENKVWHYVSNQIWNNIFLIRNNLLSEIYDLEIYKNDI